MRYLIANWKAQMTFTEIVDWLGVFNHFVDSNSHLKKQLHEQLTIVICPPFPFILYVREHLNNLPNIKVGAQNISTVKRGKFTGEVTAYALKDICDFVIVGHSERRSNFNESEEDIALKISRADQYNIQAIHCIRDERDMIYDNAKIIAFEPVEAIGTGENANPKTVTELKTKLNLADDVMFLYGGSADSTNIHDYLNTGQIDGFLVGTASLYPKEFYAMASHMVSS